jgi:hypothetical protein
VWSQIGPKVFCSPNIASTCGGATVLVPRSSMPNHGSSLRAALDTSEVLRDSHGAVEIVRVSHLHGFERI